MVASNQDGGMFIQHYHSADTKACLQWTSGSPSHVDCRPTKGATIGNRKSNLESSLLVNKDERCSWTTHVPLRRAAEDSVDSSDRPAWDRSASNNIYAKVDSSEALTRVQQRMDKRGINLRQAFVGVVLDSGAQAKEELGYRNSPARISEDQLTQGLKGKLGLDDTTAHAAARAMMAHAEEADFASFASALKENTAVATLSKPRPVLARDTDASRSGKHHRLTSSNETRGKTKAAHSNAPVDNLVDYESLHSCPAPFDMLQSGIVEPNNTVIHTGKRIHMPRLDKPDPNHADTVPYNPILHAGPRHEPSLAEADWKPRTGMLRSDTHLDDYNHVTHRHLHDVLEVGMQRKQSPGPRPGGVRAGAAWAEGPEGEHTLLAEKYALSVQHMQHSDQAPHWEGGNKSPQSPSDGAQSPSGHRHRKVSGRLRGSSARAQREIYGDGICPITHEMRPAVGDGFKLEGAKIQVHNSKLVQPAWNSSTKIESRAAEEPVHESWASKKKSKGFPPPPESVRTQEAEEGVASHFTGELIRQPQFQDVGSAGVTSLPPDYSSPAKGRGVGAGRQNCDQMATSLRWTGTIPDHQVNGHVSPKSPATPRTPA